MSAERAVTDDAGDAATTAALRERIAQLERALDLQTQAGRVAADERDYCEQVLLRLGHATERHVKTFVGFASAPSSAAATFRSVAAVGRHMRFTTPFATRHAAVDGSRDFNDVAAAIVGQQNAVAIVLPKLDVENDENASRFALMQHEADTRVGLSLKFGHAVLRHRAGSASRFGTSAPPDLLSGAFRAPVSHVTAVEERSRLTPRPLRRPATPSASSISSSPSLSMSSASDGDNDDGVEPVVSPPPLAVVQPSPRPVTVTPATKSSPSSSRQVALQDDMARRRLADSVAEVVDLPRRVSPCRGVVSPVATAYLGGDRTHVAPSSSSVPRLTGVRGPRPVAGPASVPHANTTTAAAKASGRAESPVVRRKWISSREEIPALALSPVRAPSPSVKSLAQPSPASWRTSPSALLETPLPAPPPPSTPPSSAAASPSERGSLLGTPRQYHYQTPPDVARSGTEPRVAARGSETSRRRTSPTVVTTPSTSRGGPASSSLPEDLAAQIASSLDPNKRRAVENALRTIFAVAGEASSTSASRKTVGAARQPSPSAHRRSSPITSADSARTQQQQQQQLRASSRDSSSRHRTPSPATTAARAWR